MEPVPAVGGEVWGRVKQNLTETTSCRYIQVVPTHTGLHSNICEPTSEC